LMELIPIDRRTGLSREEFIENYLKPKKPVVFTDLSKDWPAITKWTPEFLREHYGNLDVPVVGPDYHKPGPNYMKSHITMKFGEYLDMIRKGPTEYRIFLWNIFDHARELIHDVANPTICDGWVDKYPFMFFGGAGAVTNLHYDIDCSNVFHTHFWTRKHIILFEPNQSALLYQHPYTVQSHINPLEPDYNKYPALRKAVGHETILQHGETLFIPALWWHYIVYMDGGYSISLRSRDSVFTQARGLWNIARHFVIDKGMNTVMGPKWKSWKEEYARKKAEEAIQAA
ncbi:MAG TPA: cupin-like domain-containing protein, partial [Saprospiraceae bacterium]|nr:cupin-like domain-containing protein [Saprospiraceae bacterium]